MTANLTQQARRVQTLAVELAALLDGIGQGELPALVAICAAVDLDKVADDLECVAGRIADAGGALPDFALSFQESEEN